MRDLIPEATANPAEALARLTLADLCAALGLAIDACEPRTGAIVIRTDDGERIETNLGALMRDLGDMLDD